MTSKNLRRYYFLSKRLKINIICTEKKQMIPLMSINIPLFTYIIDRARLVNISA